MSVFKGHFIICFLMLLMSFIFVKHFELPCVEKCYINKRALPCLDYIEFIDYRSKTSLFFIHGLPSLHQSIHLAVVPTEMTRILLFLFWYCDQYWYSSVEKAGSHSLIPILIVFNVSGLCRSRFVIMFEGFLVSSVEVCMQGVRRLLFPLVFRGKTF